MNEPILEKVNENLFNYAVKNKIGLDGRRLKRRGSDEICGK
jgi:hypothetical protein